MGMEENAKKIVLDASMNYDKAFSAKLVNGTIVTETGMVIPEGTPIAEYQQLARTACALGKISQWAIGDIIVSAEKEHGEAAVYGHMYPLLAELWGRDEEDPMFHQHVRNIAYVSRNVKVRYPNLSWSHHREVASLPVETQEIILDKANTAGMTVKQLSVFASTYKSAYKAIEQPVKQEIIDRVPNTAIHAEEKKASNNAAFFGVADAIMNLGNEEDFAACAALIVHASKSKIGKVPPVVATTIYDAMQESEKRVVEQYIRESHGKLVFETALDEAINLMSRMSEEELSALQSCVGSEISYRGNK